MKVSDFQRKRSLINTADFPFSYNKTQAPMRNECGVYCFSMSLDKSTFCNLEAHARGALVITDAVMQPSAEIPNTGNWSGGVQSALGCAMLPPLGTVCHHLLSRTTSFHHYFCSFVFANENAQMLP